MTRIAVLGYGQLGRALAEALGQLPAWSVAVWTREPVKGAEAATGPSAAALGPSVAAVERSAAAPVFHSGPQLLAAVKDADVVFLAVPDGAIRQVVELLARLEVDWSAKAVLHPSGASSPDLLDPLANRGAAVAACHPLRAFPGPRPSDAIAAGGGHGGRDAFRDAPFTLAGSAGGVEVARRLARDVGGKPLTSQVRDRAGYHLAATIASNFALVLREWSARRFEEAGLAAADAGRAADALLRNALDNVAAGGARRALTGAIRRGDVATVEAHLSGMEGIELAAYCALGLLLLDLKTSLEGSARVIRGVLENGLRRAISTPAPEDEAVPAGEERR